MKVSQILFTFAALTLVLQGCGGPEAPLSKQSGQRNQLSGALGGTVFESRCEGNQIIHLTFEGENLTVERRTFFDPECTDRKRTVRQTGTYELANTYKEGIRDSVIWHLGGEASFTLHTDADTDNQNNLLIQARNEKETVMPANADPETKRQILRANARIREIYKLTNWTKDEAKSLNRLQTEKLPFQSELPAPFETRKSLKYEVDNGYLQIDGGPDFTHVFLKR